MAPPTDPEKDPLFRGLVLLLAVAVVAMMGFNALYRGRSNASTASADAARASSPASDHATPGVHSSGGHMTAEQMAVSHEESMTAYPAKTAGLGGRVLEPTVENGVKVFELMAMPVQWEVAPGRSSPRGPTMNKSRVRRSASAGETASG